MPGPFIVPLTCPKCRRPMSVEIRLPREFRPRQEPVVHRITCPRQDCDGVLEPVIHGDVVGVWEGHGPNPHPAPMQVA